MTTMTIWDMLEQDAPQGCHNVQDLYSWSLNYDAGKGPFPLFLDLIGWSSDNLEGSLFRGDLTETPFGHVELSKLAGALEEYAQRPHEVRDYVDQLIAAEAAE